MAPEDRELEGLGDMVVDIEPFRPAFDAFMADAAEDAILMSTKASWAGYGHGYTVELYRDGSYRLIDNNKLGSGYRSPGLLIRIPPLGEEDLNEEDEALSYFDDCLQTLRERFELCSEGL